MSYQTDYQTEQYTEREILRQSVAFIAEALGKGWAVDTSEKYNEYRCVYIDGPTGERLRFGYAQRNHDRLVISGEYPRCDDMSMPRVAKNCEITVGRMRLPDVVAKDIRHRLLPDYQTALDAVRDAYDDAALALSRRTALSKRLGGHLPEHLQSESRTVIITNIGDVRVDARLGYRGDSVHFELSSVPAELAVKIMNLLRTAAAS